MLALEAATLFAFSAIQSPFQVGIGLFLLGLFSQAFRPANTTAIVNACPPNVRATALALNRLAINLGMSIGPVFGGFLAVRNYQWLFYIDASTCVAAMILIILFFFRHEPVSAIENSDNNSK